ncbi:hypothetical protein [Bacillus cereus]|uniref:hypothetical protein n=1 Tax=Bacillus cereus TaxID=1396 RepID=UPI003A8129D3
MLDTLDVIKRLLRGCTSGPLQKLAAEYITKKKQELELDWSFPLKPFGLKEGTAQTKPGTPDLWTEKADGKFVFIQATGDKTKGKMLGDLKKSVKKMKKLGDYSGSHYIAFLNYDPDLKELKECRELCATHSITFEYFDNVTISEDLMKQYTDLQAKYLGINVFWEEGKLIEDPEPLKCMSCYKVIRTDNDIEDAGLFCTTAKSVDELDCVFWVHEQCLDSYKKSFDLKHLSTESIRDFLIPTVYISRILQFMGFLQGGVQIDSAAYINLHNFIVFASNYVYRAQTEKELERIDQIYPPEDSRTE